LGYLHPWFYTAIFFSMKTIKRKKIIQFHFILLFLFVSCSLFSATLKVGKKEKYKNIPDALYALKDGDTLIIQTGEYRSDQAIINMKNKKNIKIIGQGRVDFIEESRYPYVIYLENCEGVTLKNLHARHAYSPHGSCEAGVLFIRNCKNMHIEQCELNGSGIVGIELIDSENVKIISNFIHNNSSTGLSISNSKKVVVQRNRITKNYRAVFLENCTDIQFINNEIKGNEIGDETIQQEG